MHNIPELLLFYLYLKHCKYILSELQTVEKQLLHVKEPNSVKIIDAQAAKLSNYSYPITKVQIGYPRDRATIM